MLNEMKLNASDCTVVIVTYNSAHCIDCLRMSLSETASIIFVDNGSEDGTAEAIIAGFPKASLIRKPRNVGFGAANNAALGLVKTKYALLLNPDCILGQDSIELLLNAADQFPDAAIIAPALVRGNGAKEISYRWPGKLWRSRGPEANGACCVGFVSGAAMLLNMAVMRDIGFFDETFFLYYEDEDLCQRVFAARKQIIVDPDVQLTHLSRGSVRGRNPLKSEFIRGYHHAQSKLVFEHKHVSVESASKLRWRTLLLALATMLPRLLLPQPKYLARLCGRIAGLCLPYPKVRP